MKKDLILRGTLTVSFANPKRPVMTFQEDSDSTPSMKSLTIRMREFLVSRGGFCTRTEINFRFPGMPHDIRHAALRQIATVEYCIRKNPGVRTTSVFVLKDSVAKFKAFAKKSKWLLVD